MHYAVCDDVFQQLAELGKRYSKLCQLPNIYRRFVAVETDAEWGKRLAKHQVRRHGPNPTLLILYYFILGTVSLLGVWP